VITSASNPRLKLVRRLESRRQRERLGLFVCEGEDLVAAALDAGLEPVEALVDGERPALLERLPRHELVAPALLAEVASLAHPPRLIALFRTADLPLGPLPPDALGPAFLALSRGSADPLGSKATRAAMGALFRVPLVGFEEAPRPRVALVPAGGRTLADLDLAAGVTFVLGSERAGLPEHVVSACEERASIPLAAHAESLNVAMAGTIALYERARATQTLSSPPA
jgi:TrmH family RNA methyltransferase